MIISKEIIFSKKVFAIIKQPGETQNLIFISSMLPSQVLLELMFSKVTKRKFLDLNSEWYISEQLCHTNNNSVKVHGWNYYDDTYVWPENNTLFITGMGLFANFYRKINFFL